MPQKPKSPLEFPEMPGPHSWAKAAGGALIGMGGLIGDQTGLIVGIVIGAALAIGMVLYWVSRPK
jgi:hypothetical protein